MGKEKAKLLLFANYMTLHRKNPNNFTKNLLEPISEFSEVVGYKNINTNICCASIY